MDKKANRAKKEKPKLNENVNTNKDQSTINSPPIQNNKGNNNNDEDDYNSEEDEKSILNFDSELLYIKNLKGVDVVFLIDTTGSMNPYMKELRHFIRKLCNDIQKTMSQYYIDDIDLIQYGIVTYRDHDQENKTYVSRVDCHLTWEYSIFRTHLKDLNCRGGGDESEAVADGLNEAIHSIKWREASMKYIYHILDNPPHGQKYSGGLQDNYPECPCLIRIGPILRDLRGKSIYYTIVKLNDNIVKMIEAFSNTCKIDVMLGKIAPDESQSAAQYDNDEVNDNSSLNPKSKNE